MQHHYIVTVNELGELEKFPMKKWLRSHPDILPGIDVKDHTSHSIRSKLLRLGWKKESSEGEVLILQPEAFQHASSKGLLSPRDQNDTLSSEEDELSFEMEAQLRDFIASNLSTIEINNKRLRLFVDQNGQYGIEFHTGVGYVDILAEDAEGSLYVFELKRAKSPDQAVGQVARYMGWLKNNGFADREIVGVIVAKEITDKLKYALDVIPNVLAFEYSVTFSLNRVALD